MTTSIPLSRAVATATATLGACVFACLCPSGCALQGACASTAWAFSPSTKTGGESTPLDLNSSSGGSHATSAGGASLVRTIVGLAIVIAVIWGLAWVLRQVKAGKEGGRDSRASSAGLSSIAALTLGSGRSVHLVRAGSDYVLLGSSEHGLAPIHRYTEEEAREAGLFLDELPPERSRIVTVAGQLTRSVVQGSYSARGDFGDFAGDQSVHSPAIGRRADPMHAPAPSANLLERLREMTVRR
jgi:flagellar protein FliO/FliZ